MRIRIDNSASRNTPVRDDGDAHVARAVAPCSVEVAPRRLRVGDGYCATLVITGYPAEVGPAWLEPLLSWPGRLDLALHIDPLPNPVAASRLRSQRARFESSRRADLDRGRLTDPQIEAAADDAADLAARLARGAAKLHRVGIYLTVHARTETELDQACAQVTAAAASTLLDAQPATWRHLHGWTTTLPFGHDALGMTRILDTDALAAAFPLASLDLPAPLPGDEQTHRNDGGVLYGLNPASNGIVWWDRWAQENYNSVVLARSGAGKSYFVKLDVLRNLYLGAHAAVIDPEDEYLRLAEAVGGTVVRLGAPGVRVNPLDIPTGDARPDVLTRRGLFLHTLINVMLGPAGSGSAMKPEQSAALDRAILAAYRRAGITADPRTHTRPAPLLRDLTGALTQDADPAAQRLAARLAPWTQGSFKDLFDGPSTHQPTGHLVVWSLRHLPDELRAAGTMLALDSIWRQVDLPPQSQKTSQRQGRLPRRLIVVDEAWLLMRDGEGARFLHRLAKAGRKRHTGLTVVTQDAADVLGSDLGQAVVSNATTQILLRQAPQAIDAVGAAFGLTAGERRMLLAARRGHGLLLSGNHRTGFESVASAAEHALATTDPTDPVNDLDLDLDLEREETPT